MRVHNEKLEVRVLALAVQGALVAMFALPLMAAAEDDGDAQALKHPTNFVEIGAMNVSSDSAKFGEYNGLDDSHLYGLANFGVSGGDAYEEGDGTMRWEIKGVDLGTTSRSLGATVGNQGKWSLGISYDELRHNISDTYQTPQQGSMGGNHFTMPANFGVINAQANPSARSLDATQLADFHKKDVHVDRENTSFNAAYTFSPQISLQFDYNHLNQDGAKLLGTGALGGVTVAGVTFRAEANNIIMNPTNYETDNFNLALNWTGDKGHLTVGYYGSLFRDGYSSLSLQNALRQTASGTCASGGSCTYQDLVMSTAPDNSLHQINLAGGYAFSPATKLSGGVSYSRNIQDDKLLTQIDTIALPALPRSSFDGKVITTHADLKLTHQATKDLALSAGFKYNERDNKSSSDMYGFYAINNHTTVDYAANAPYSNRKTQYELAADYRLTKGQNVRVAYERENVKRWCNDYANDGSCLVNPSNEEDKLSLSYRLRALDNVSFNAGYTYADRRADFNGNAVTPLSGLDTATPEEVNAQDYPGFHAYPYAERTQNQLKAGVNWQATEKLDLGLSGRYAHENYDTTLGAQDGHNWSLNLDAAFAYAENGSVGAYASWGRSERDFKSGLAGNGAVNTADNFADLVAPTNIWSHRLQDESKAFGINAKQGRLMGGKLDLMADLSYSFDRSYYSSKVPSAANCGTAGVLTCGDTTDIKYELIALKLTGSYQVNKNGKIAVGYLFQKLNGNDYYYNGLQYGTTPNRVMPTMEKAPDYSVNVLSATYTYTF